MSSQIELTLGELARIALGTQKFGPDNLAVLHSLIDILLRKLDCRDEKVKIGGYETNCLKKMLKSSKINPFAFQEDQLDILSEKFKRITELEKRVETVQNRLSSHFEEIEHCNKDSTGAIFDTRNWEHYASMCEDICAICEPENVSACQLIQNADFMKKMLRRIAFPLVNRMLKFEKRVEILHDDFKKFIETTKEHYLKMSLVERCVQEIEHVRQEVENHHLRFLSIMEEVQDMFDSKLDKIHLPALKKYVRDRFDAIESLLDAEKTVIAPKPDGIIMDGIKCLSCGNERVRVDKTINIKGVFPEAHTKIRPKIFKKYCKCRAEPHSVTQMQLPSDCVEMVKVKPVHVIPRSCSENEFVFKEGKNKMLYRMISKKEELQEELKDKKEGDEEEEERKEQKELEELKEQKEIEESKEQQEVEELKEQNEVEDTKEQEEVEESMQQKEEEATMKQNEVEELKDQTEVEESKAHESE